MSRAQVLPPAESGVFISKNSRHVKIHSEGIDKLCEEVTKYLFKQKRVDPYSVPIELIIVTLAIKLNVINHDKPITINGCFQLLCLGVISYTIKRAIITYICMYINFAYNGNGSNNLDETLYFDRFLLFEIACVVVFSAILYIKKPSY